jgi:hypothetical protein
MLEVTLTYQSPQGPKQVPIKGDRLSIGRDATADLVIADEGLSRLHASIHREGDRVWILDERSTNGSYVNGTLVPPAGTPLADGDEILIGHHTTLRVQIRKASAVTAGAMGPGARPATASAISSPTLIIIAACFIAVILVGAAALSLSSSSNGGTNTNLSARDPEPTPTPGEIGDATPTPIPSPTPALTNQVAQFPTPVPVMTPIGTPKLYMQMSETEKLDFIDRRAQHISLMMSNRAYTFNNDVLLLIKKYVDGYASRATSTSTKLWGEGLRTLYGRASQYAPYINKSFNEKGVPPVVGLYLAMIETEYNPCLTSPVGAKGLFQFMPETARGYGVDPADRCDVEKMAPAAAAYISDRIAEFGTDSMSVALGIAGYNRSPDSVRRDLQDVLNSDNKERSFWTLVANSNKLDRYFQGENIKYVPKFFAAAIVGETPQAFGLQINPLSSYTSTTIRPSVIAVSQPAAAPTAPR